MCIFRIQRKGDRSKLSLKLNSKSQGNPPLPSMGEEPHELDNFGRFSTPAPPVQSTSRNDRPPVESESAARASTSRDIVQSRRDVDQHNMELDPQTGEFVASTPKRGMLCNN